MLQAESQLYVDSFMCSAPLPEGVLTLTLLLREACLSACNKQGASEALGGDMTVKPNFTAALADPQPSTRFVRLGVCRGMQERPRIK